MTRFFTSDVHFGHRNVIGFCDRPYANVEEMDAAIIKQWNSQVKPEDEVFFLGDFGVIKSKVLEDDLVNQLNGKKHLILGNHDSGFNSGHGVDDHSNKMFTKAIRKLEKAGWTTVQVYKELKLKDGTLVTMTHLPPDSDHDNRYTHYKIPQDKNKWHLHAHLHGRYRKHKNLIDVCFDGDLNLLTEDDIIEIKNDPRDFIPTRLTDFYAEETALSLKPFEEEVVKKNVRKVVSNCGDLVLYNYTDACVFAREWNDVTRHSRGIIFEKATGKLVALPFPKFFNLGEMPETRIENLPDEKYTIAEKMDGSLGIIYNYKGKWKVATRGSFTSEQAVKAEEILQGYTMSEVPEELTILTEIIYPENKIVANYGGVEMLMILGAYNRDTQEEVDLDTLKLIQRDSGMPLVERHSHTIQEMVDLQAILPKDREGFVVRFDSGLRIKLKGAEYSRIHKMISQMSPLSFWATIEQGKVNVSYLQELPEEYRDEADLMVIQLEENYSKLENMISTKFTEVMEHLQGTPESELRKALGLYLKDNKVEHGGAFWGLLDEKPENVEKYIMREIRPKGNSLC